MILRSGYRTRNFHGAIKKLPPSVTTKSSSEPDAGITYQCETLQTSPSHSHIEFQFCKPSMFLAVAEPESLKLKQVSLRIRTTEPHGLILFYRHRDGATFTAVDMYDGAVSVFIRRSEIVRLCCDDQPTPSVLFHTKKGIEETFRRNIEQEENRSCTKSYAIRKNNSITSRTFVFSHQNRQLSIFNSIIRRIVSTERLWDIGMLREWELNVFAGRIQTKKLQHICRTMTDFFNPPDTADCLN